MGQWRGAWSADSGLWERYPSIKAKLLLGRREPGTDTGVQRPGTGGGGGGDVARDERGTSAASASAFAIAQGIPTGEAEEELWGAVREENDGSSFWMPFDDLIAEFSQARTQHSSSVTTGAAHGRSERSME